MDRLLNIFLTFIMLLSIYSCKDESNDNVYIDMHIDLSFYNKKGDDLLSEKTEGAYDTSKISYFAKDTQDNQVSLGLKVFLDSSNKYYLRLFSSNATFEIRPNVFRSYLKLSETDIDTIDVKFNSGSDNIYIKKVWYNDVVISRGATILKDK